MEKSAGGGLRGGIASSAAVATAAIVIRATVVDAVIKRLRRIGPP